MPSTEIDNRDMVLSIKEKNPSPDGAYIADTEQVQSWYVSDTC